MNALKNLALITALFWIVPAHAGKEHPATSISPEAACAQANALANDRAARKNTCYRPCSPEGVVKFRSKTVPMCSKSGEQWTCFAISDDHESSGCGSGKVRPAKRAAPTPPPSGKPLECNGGLEIISSSATQITVKAHKFINFEFVFTIDGRVSTRQGIGAVPGQTYNGTARAERGERVGLRCR